MKIKREIFDEMVKDCRERFPEEACGILAGRDKIGEKIYKMKNIERSSVSFLMEPKEQLYVMKDIRENNMEMVSIYHSHPFTFPYPSKRDVELAFYTDVIYLIVSLSDINNPLVKGYRIIDGKIEEEKIEIIE